MPLSKSCGRRASSSGRSVAEIALADVCLAARLWTDRENDDQHELVVLLRGDGPGRLPAAAFLHLLPVVAAERGQLAPQTRQQVNQAGENGVGRAARGPVLALHLQPVMSPPARRADAPRVRTRTQAAGGCTMKPSSFQNSPEAA